MPWNIPYYAATEVTVEQAGCTPKNFYIYKFANDLNNTCDYSNLFKSQIAYTYYYFGSSDYLRHTKTYTRFLPRMHMNMCLQITPLCKLCPTIVTFEGLLACVSAYMYP